MGEGPGVFSASDDTRSDLGGSAGSTPDVTGATVSAWASTIGDAGVAALPRGDAWVPARASRAEDGPLAISSTLGSGDESTSLAGCSRAGASKLAEVSNSSGDAASGPFDLERIALGFEAGFFTGVGITKSKPIGRRRRVAVPVGNLFLKVKKVSEQS